MTANVLPGTTQTAPRVVMVLPAYLPETFGGAEQQTRRLAQALAGRGVAVTLLAPRLEAERRRGRRRGQLWFGASGCGRPRIWADDTSMPSCGGVLCISSWLRRNRRSYDLIYVVHGRLHAFPAVVAGKWLRKPVVVKPGRGGETHFDLSVVQRKRLLGPFFARRIARNTTAWVANSREIAADLSGWGVPQRAHPSHSQRGSTFRRMDFGRQATASFRCFPWAA